jgi:hypothetical protein
VADVLEFAPLDLARFVRQIGMLAFKGLHARQFVRAHDPLALSRQLLRGFLVERTNIGDFSLEAIIAFVGRGQPVVAAQVRFEIPLFSSRPAWRGEIVSTMPRRENSSAISRPVHWLIGRPESPGVTHSQER